MTLPSDEELLKAYDDEYPAGHAAAVCAVCDLTVAKLAEGVDVEAILAEARVLECPDRRNGICWHEMNEVCAERVVAAMQAALASERARVAELVEAVEAVLGFDCFGDDQYLEAISNMRSALSAYQKGCNGE